MPGAQQAQGRIRHGPYPKATPRRPGCWMGTLTKAWANAGAAAGRHCAHAGALCGGTTGGRWVQLHMHSDPTLSFLLHTELGWSWPGWQESTHPPPPPPHKPRVPPLDRDVPGTQAASLAAWPRLPCALLARYLPVTSFRSGRPLAPQAQAHLSRSSVPLPRGQGRHWEPLSVAQRPEEELRRSTG